MKNDQGKKADSKLIFPDWPNVLKLVPGDEEGIVSSTYKGWLKRGLGKKKDSVRNFLISVYQEINHSDPSDEQISDWMDSLLITSFQDAMDCRNYLRKCTYDNICGEKDEKFQIQLESALEQIKNIFEVFNSTDENETEALKPNIYYDTDEEECGIMGEAGYKVYNILYPYIRAVYLNECGIAHTEETFALQVEVKADIKSGSAEWEDAVIEKMQDQIPELIQDRLDEDRYSLDEDIAENLDDIADDLIIEITHALNLTSMNFVEVDSYEPEEKAETDIESAFASEDQELLKKAFVVAAIDKTVDNQVKKAVKDTDKVNDKERTIIDRDQYNERIIKRKTEMMRKYGISQSTIYFPQENGYCKSDSKIEEMINDIEEKEGVDIIDKKWNTYLDYESKWKKTDESIDQLIRKIEREGLIVKPAQDEKTTNEPTQDKKTDIDPSQSKKKPEPVKDKNFCESVYDIFFKESIWDCMRNIYMHKNGIREITGNEIMSCISSGDEKFKEKAMCMYFKAKIDDPYREKIESIYNNISESTVSENN